MEAPFLKGPSVVSGRSLEVSYNSLPFTISSDKESRGLGGGPILKGPSIVSGRSLEVSYNSLPFTISSDKESRGLGGGPIFERTVSSLW